MWEDPVEAENFESSDSQGFAPPEEVVHSAPPLEKMRFSHEEINLSESDKPAVIFAECQTRQYWCFSRSTERVGEMAQQLRALTALPEVLSSNPSNYTVAHNHL